MHQFKVGEKVIVKAMSERPLRWNSNGYMDKYMGTVQTIEKLEEVKNGTRVTLYGCRSPLELDWAFRTEDLLPVPKPGDKVRIRSWEDMRDQYGFDEYGNIKCKYFFTKYMGKYAGGIFTVSSADDDSFSIGKEDFIFSFECIEEVHKKRDCEMKFTKKDLRNGMTVKVGDNVYMVHESILLCNGGWLDLTKYRDDLTFDGHSIWDIQDVCDITKEGLTSISDILEQRGPQLWPKKVKEVSVSEVLDILGEKFGCEVKIVEDNQSGGE